VEWGRSDLERRHNVVGSLSWFVRPWLDLTSVVRVSSGTPYTPRVGSDINGDGARNDRAFVFDPADVRAAGDTALAKRHGAPHRGDDGQHARVPALAARRDRGAQQLHERVESHARPAGQPAPRTSEARSGAGSTSCSAS
jgi:hypothetical protein